MASGNITVTIDVKDLDKVKDALEQLQAELEQERELAKNLYDALVDLYETSLIEAGIENFQIVANDTSAFGNAKGAIEKYEEES